jgi:ribonucleoside-diphosphate reductase alpha chain
MLKIKKISLPKPITVYDISVEDTHNFFANDIVVHNCEITLPTVPLNDINDANGRIALCTLSAINWGLIKTPEDFEKPCTLAVRGLDALLSYQHYPVLAAELSTKEFRPLGVGIINFAYWLAKNDVSYTDPRALPLVDQYAEAWSYYLIRASIDLAQEFAPCQRWQDTKYGHGIMPIDTYKREVDELVPPQQRQFDWQYLRDRAREHGIRNATLMAAMPCETSAQISNSTNGVEPPRGYVTTKGSKDGQLKQVVPEYRRLKNRYELLWDQKSPEGYLKIMAVLQKYIDQGISVNTSYNPQHYPDEKIPMSEMLQHLIMFYKYGGKQLYYFNTYDGQGEIDTDRLADAVAVTQAPLQDDQNDCDGCKI